MVGSHGLNLWPELFLVSILPILYTIHGYKPIKYVAHLVVGLILLSIFWRWVLDSLKNPACRMSSNFGVRNLVTLFSTIGFAIWSTLGFLQGAFNGFASPIAWWIDALNVIAAFYLFSLLVCAGKSSKEKPPAWQIGVIVGLSIYFLTNIVLWFIGIQSSGGIYTIMGENRILALIGISAVRVAFPITSGLNGAAIFAAASIGIGLAFIFTQKTIYIRVLAFALIGTAAFVILMSDSRGALFSIIAVLLVAILVRYAAFRKFLPAIYLLLPLLPVVAIAFVSLIPKDLIFGFFSRGGEQFVTPAAALTTGRNYVWSAVLSLLEDPSFNVIYGWGIYGHVVSGASSKFAWIFDDSGITAHTTHNMYLQTFVDRGIIGVLILVLTIFFVTRSLVRRYTECQVLGVKVTEPLMGIFIITSLVAGGGSEAVLSLYFPDHLWMFFLACSLAYTARID